MSTDPGSRTYWGRVRRPPDDGYPRRSSLVDQFGLDVDGAADAIVLRGYSGRSTIAERGLEFLHIARQNGQPEDEVAALEALVEPLRDAATTYILRVYLTPRLDRYVDFHRSCLIGWRYEAKAERQDAITVWLRAVDNARVPIPYRVVSETRIGPSTSAYLGGSLLEDYIGAPGSQSSAWGTQSGLYWGGGKGTTPRCAE